MASVWAALQRRAAAVRRVRLTLFGRACAILAAELAANALLWLVAAVLFTRPGQDRNVLSLTLVAWTTGLRHGLDADHISLIDNAVRRIMAEPPVGTPPRPRRPVTVGLFFSLGHSTVVFVTTIIIAVSVAAANHLDGFGEKGGIVGASISGSTLLLLAAINSVLLWKTWRRLQAARKAQAEAELSTEKGIDDGPLSPGVEKTDEAQLRDTEQQTPPRKLHFEGCLTRAVAPLLRALDRPWKLFPIGLLFGLGFDTASTIALLSVALAASQTGGDAGASSAKVVLLALLFTAGMSLVDTCDNILMLFCYAPERPVGPARWRIFEVRAAPEPQPALPDDELVPELPASVAPRFDAPASTLSLGLTALSICLAASIGLIVLLGLIGDECARCVRAADKQDETGDGGLEGRWWLAWRRANDQSGYIGAAIVGVFALSLAVFYASRWLRSRYARPATPAPQQPVL